MKLIRFLTAVLCGSLIELARCQDQDAIIVKNATSNLDTDTTTISKMILGGNCLVNQNFCLNGGKCGLNGNCICARFFFGGQCEQSITMDKRVTMMQRGIGQERVFLICAMFILVLPLLAYFLFSCCLKMCDSDSDESYFKCLKDTFFCFTCCCNYRREKIPEQEMVNPPP